MSKAYLEGSLIVEMKNGDRRIVKGEVFEGMVRHGKIGDAFGEIELTPEDEFRRQMRCVVSRSPYDKR